MTARTRRWNLESARLLLELGIMPKAPLQQGVLLGCGRSAGR
jgi:hypothetical protein